QLELRLTRVDLRAGEADPGTRSRRELRTAHDGNLRASDDGDLRTHDREAATADERVRLRTGADHERAVRARVAHPGLRAAAEVSAACRTFELDGLHLRHACRVLRQRGALRVGQAAAVLFILPGANDIQSVHHGLLLF